MLILDEKGQKRFVTGLRREPDSESPRPLHDKRTGREAVSAFAADGRVSPELVSWFAG